MFKHFLRHTLVLFSFLFFSCITFSQDILKVVASKDQWKEKLDLVKNKEDYKEQFKDGKLGAYEEGFQELVKQWDQILIDKGNTNLYRTALIYKAEMVANFLYKLAMASEFVPELAEVVRKKLVAQKALFEELKSFQPVGLESFTQNGTEFKNGNYKRLYEVAFADYYGAWMVLYYYNGQDYESIIDYAYALNEMKDKNNIRYVPMLIGAHALFEYFIADSTFWWEMNTGAQFFAGDYLVLSKKEEVDSAVMGNRNFILYLYDEILYEKEENIFGHHNPVYITSEASLNLYDLEDLPLAGEYAAISIKAGNADLDYLQFALDSIKVQSMDKIAAATAVDTLLKYEFRLNNVVILRLKQLSTEQGWPSREQLCTEILARREKAAKAAIKKEKSLNARQHFSLLAGVEPLGFIYGQANMALELRTKNIIQEFRFAHIYAGRNKWRFGQAFDSDDNDKKTYRFQGFEAQYGLKFLALKYGKSGFRYSKGGRATGTAGYIGVDLRFAAYHFDSTQTNVLDLAGNYMSGPVMIHPTSYRYEGAVKFGSMGFFKYIYVDVWLGLGVGYRSLVTREGYDMSVTDFSDKRFDYDRWNKFYVPFRAGIRLGIMIL